MSSLARIPGIKYAVRVRDTLKWAYYGLNGKGFIPGHYHSTIPDIRDIHRRESRIWPDFPESLPGIDLNEEEQISVLDEFAGYYADMPYKEPMTSSTRYTRNNSVYPISDATALYSMIRKLKPQRIIEVGSGYSSCVMMDTNELFFEDKIQITFVEPYPDRLISLMKNGDLNKYRLIKSELQNMDKDMFLSLQANDILFIDSTHVSKIGSDVNCIIFELLPLLNRGVHIHFHDIFYPFEYPKQWIYRERYWWNENYILRAFLQYNDSYKIVFFNTYLEHFHKEKYRKLIPVGHGETLPDVTHQGSIWLKKVK